MKYNKIVSAIFAITLMCYAGNAYALGNVVIETGAGKLITIIYKESDHGKKIADAFERFTDKISKKVQHIGDKGLDVSGDTLVFFEKNSCHGNIKGTMPLDTYRHVNAKHRQWFDNDEVRSMLIRSKAVHKDIYPAVAGSVITVYDSPSSHKKTRMTDPYAVIKVHQDLTNAEGDVCITTFEDTNAQLTSNGKQPAVQVSFVQPKGKGKLDGKVTTIVAAPGKKALNYVHEEWVKALPYDLMFYEGEGCTQGVKGKLFTRDPMSINCKHSNRCANDEIKSVRIGRWARSGADIKLYDDPKADHDHSWAVVKLRKHQKHGHKVWGFSGATKCVSSFEHDKDYGEGTIKVERKNKDKDELDGKISHIKITR